MGCPFEPPTPLGCSRVNRQTVGYDQQRIPSPVPLAFESFSAVPMQSKKMQSAVTHVFSVMRYYKGNVPKNSLKDIGNEFVYFCG